MLAAQTAQLHKQLAHILQQSNVLVNQMLGLPAQQTNQLAGLARNVAVVEHHVAHDFQQVLACLDSTSRLGKV